MEITSANILHMIVSAVLFICAWKVIGEGLIKPFIDLLIEREEKTVGDEKKARETKERSLRVESDIEAELNEARVEGMALKDSQVEKAKEEAEKILSEARAKAEKELLAGREEIAKLAKAAQLELGGQAEDLASVIVEKAGQTSVRIH